MHESLAKTSWILFLVALLLLPGVAAIPVVVWFFKHRGKTWWHSHIRGAFYACVGVAYTLVIIPALVLLSVEHTAMMWASLIVWWVSTHGFWVVAGVYGLSRALNKKYLFSNQAAA